MILALETSSKLCSVALIDKGACIDVEEQLGEKFIHAEALHPMIEKLLKRNDIPMSQLSCIAVGIGPGSYTGLRIGLAAAKGFAYALNIPLFAANTDQLLRASLKSEEVLLPVISVVDARRQDAYVCDNHGVYSFQTTDEQWRKGIIDERILVIGDCADKVVLNALDQTIVRFPSAKYFAEIIGTNCKFVEEIGALEPYYMKEFEPTLSKKKITDL